MWVVDSLNSISIEEQFVVFVPKAAAVVVGPDLDLNRNPSLGWKRY